MSAFFQTRYARLVDSPNGTHIWWHSMPLPDGTRVNGQNPDKDLQLKKWHAMQIPSAGGLDGRHVLDIGANDGFFSIAALMAGAASVTSVDSAWGTWPHNIGYASRVWEVAPEIVTADFRTHAFPRRYDTIFLLGVLYHLQDVFGCMGRMAALLADGGQLYLETQMAQVQSELPVFECASDIYPTVARQGKESLGSVGISNFLFPNEHAMRNLAHAYDFRLETLEGPHNAYTRENPTRRVFLLRRN